MKLFQMIAAALFLSLLISGACAESILPMMTPVPTAALVVPAADAVARNAQGGTVVTYRNVSADGFNSFGAYLGERGYHVDGTETQGEHTAYALSDGQTDFVMFYQVAEQVMTLVYPDGTDYEQPRFPGYQLISLDEEIMIPNLGRFTPIEFCLNEKETLAGMVERIGGYNSYYDVNGHMIFSNELEKVYTFLGFRFFNVTNGDLQFSDNRNDLLTMTLHYVCEYGEYSYEQSAQASYKSTVNMFVSGYRQAYDGLYYMSRPIGSMTEGIKYAIFDVPSGVRGAADGTLYVTIEFATGDRYAIVLRENGVNYYETQTN